ncbi:RagB/SusD family nutrient uptake outer membrane protein [Nubsella zeaxanthinifaciens]|jgi:hypothetical protein|uniref:RagB/SusD family nutrient uptake outer membrane protein n=1 Tax=Nubsella zeaxanthinifaciens TaxID=392412 RepID=UPI000DE4B927|nr:RagB/SusD family nutrient uptake outer membrane protein [Nubsella zeaxanthinifaciens]
MKQFNKLSIRFIIVVSLALASTSCKKLVDQEPISNEVVDNYYKNYKEVNVALSGCYNGMQEPLLTEWQFTELRSDNARQRSVNSTTNVNMELNVLNLYTAGPSHQQIYNYWLAVYKNIRNVNYVLRSLGVSYQNNQLVFGKPTADVTDAQRNELAGQALFIRAYHYFNLVRLYGGVFIVTEPVDAAQARKINRSSVNECYNLIVKDLEAAVNLASARPFGQIPSTDLGRANSWAAKGLLAKVFLTLPVPRNADALTLLNDIIANSGYGLESTFPRVFAVNNEMNKEILFAVRYKAGLVGLGNPMPNLFAPASSGDAIINGDGSGFNYPSTSIYGAFTTGSAIANDTRRDATISIYANSTTPYYVNKFFSKVVVAGDGENDFTVLRFADILLMKAEAQGYDGPAGSSMAIINQIRERAGAVNYTTGTFTSAFYKYPASGAPSIATNTDFLAALLKERRLEFAFENQRLFDLIRFGQAVSTIQTHYANEYQEYYRRFTPVIPLATLQANVTNEKLLLPIPQREIDTNTDIKIQQNPGY